jgi:amino acid adenylation domain-containing protein
MIMQRDSAARDETLHARFEHIADTNPHWIAVVAGNEVLTYGELNERANQVAWRLADLGVRRHTVVGLCADRSADMIVGILAVIKAGAAYVPLDPGYPQQRLELMLKDSGASVIVTQRQLIPKLPSGISDFLALDDGESFVSYPVTNPQGPSSAQDGAYVIYTSGSTGPPKGVLATHDNVANLVRHQSYLTIEPQDRVAAIASLSFDASTFEIWGALLNGASCYIYNFIGRNLSEFFWLIRRDEISVLALTSPVFRILEPDHFELAQGVRAMLFGGDSVRTDVVNRARQLFRGDLIHVYGPTETTSFATVLIEHTVTDGTQHTVTENPSLYPIGYPIRGVTVQVIRPNGEPAADAGDEGELYIGGRGVARGYLNSPELTAERFIPDPSGAPGSRLYRTGDLVRVGRQGELHFLGRLDRQLKIRGHRIEPAEIEATLTRYAGVSDVVVVGRSDGAGDKRLHAYVIRTRDDPRADRELIADLRRYVGTVLPRQQHPATFTVIESIPFTSNFKVDESRLPEPRKPERPNDPDPAGLSEDMESALAALWESKLDVNAIGIDDNFFELGGDSMMALQVVTEAERTMGVQISVRSMFKYPTIRKLTEALAREGCGESDGNPATEGR